MKGKTALVTGAAVGFKDGGPSIGSGIAFKLAAEGAQVVVVDILDDMGQRTADRIEEDGGTALFVKADVSRINEVQHTIEMTRQTFGQLHCLVNCAASYQGDIFKNVVETPEEDWNRVLDVNLNGYFRFAKAAIPLMLQSSGGTIVNISSCAAFQVVKDFCVYPVTKAAINGLTRTLAVDFAPQIRANAICPGFVRIANSEGDRSPDEINRWIGDIAQTYPLRRTCSVEEIANVALFLACEDSSYINGQCIVVDGGRIVSDTHEF